jgi:hypothetical protein
MPQVTETALGMHLADLATCGEDFARNLRRVMAIALTHCDGCADYHIAHVAKRLTGRTGWSHGARESLVDALQPILADLAVRDNGRIDVVVAACADTAVLATCAHAASLTGEGLLGRTRFSVLDRCRTPLALCEEFGQRYELTVRTDTVDLTETSKHIPADLIVLHNLLSYVPEERHRPLLQTLAGWLKVGGRLILWNDLVPPEHRDRFHLFLETQVADVKAMLNRGEMEIGEPKAAFIARLERTLDRARRHPHRLTDTESFTELIASVGLKVLSTEETLPVGLLPDSSATSFPCVLIVAGPA